jgi:cellulose synthase/poly-beta-1,6-N-acetylglucosamine synthase-like glycosyltransferase
MIVLISSYLLIAISASLAVPATIFAAEILATLSRRRHIVHAALQRGTVAVLVPAHNEADGILPALAAIKAQLGRGDRLVVVADNCTDNTAAISSSAGAEVVVRSDPLNIGKGFALDWGLKFIGANPPEFLVMVDADCHLAAGVIDELVHHCARSRRPVQSLYLMSASDKSKINHQVAEFAWRVKNWVRPLGLRALGLPCQLMGSGMAFPWAIIRSVNLSSGAIVEDLKLGLDLAAAGHAPLFCPSAVVTSGFPNSAEGALKQRKRWEHGQMGMIRTLAVPCLAQAIRTRDLNLLALVFDLLVPPLSMLLFMILACTLAAGLSHFFLGLSSTAFEISLGSLATVLLAVIFAWAAYGRDALPPASLARVPSYLVMKVRLYAAAALGERISRWARADRN